MAEEHQTKRQDRSILRRLAAEIAELQQQWSDLRDANQLDRDALPAVEQAIKELEGKRREKVSENRVYFQSALITGVLGSIDELYQGVLPMRVFTWYDIFLNMLGGILGLTLFWGITMKSVNHRT